MAIYCFILTIIFSSISIIISSAVIYYNIKNIRNTNKALKILEEENDILFNKSNYRHHPLSPNWKAVKEAERIIGEVKWINKSDFCQ